MVPVTPKPYFNVVFLRPDVRVYFNHSLPLQRFRQFLSKINLSKIPTWSFLVLDLLIDEIIQLRTLRRHIVISGFDYNFIPNRKEVQ